MKRSAHKLALSRWFSIDKDGQPTLPGRYEVRYIWEEDDHPNLIPTFYFWNGSTWLRAKGDRQQLEFGNTNTEGERWRGLASDPNKGA